MFYFDKIKKDNRIKYIVAKCDFKRHKERKMSYSLNHPPPSPFYRVVCTCRVYNTVLWWFSWWYLYFCIHFGDPVISGFYKPRLFLNLALPLASLFLFSLLNHSNVLVSQVLGLVDVPDLCVAEWVSPLCVALMQICEYEYTYINTYSLLHLTVVCCGCRGVSVSSSNCFMFILNVCAVFCSALRSRLVSQ